MVEQPSECIFLVEARSKQIIEANGAFRKLLGYAPEKFRGMTLYDFVAHDQASIDENTRLSVKKGRHDIGERRYRRRDGELVYVEVRSNTLLIDGREVLCCVSHDVTERKLAEQRRDTQYAVSLILAESASLEEASPKLLDATGAGLGWELGALWMMDRDANVLRCKEVWCAPSVAMTGFEAAPWDTSPTPGRELPGRVWESEEPVWIPDGFNDTTFLRPKSVARAGLRGPSPSQFGAKAEFSLVDMNRRMSREQYEVPADGIVQHREAAAYAATDPRCLAARKLGVRLTCLS